MAAKSESALSTPPRRRRSSKKLVGIVLFALAGLGAMTLGAVYLALIKKADATLAEAVAEADRLDPGWRFEEIKAVREKDVIPVEEDAAPRVIRALLLSPDHLASASTPGIPAMRAPADASYAALLNYPQNMRLGVDLYAGLIAQVRRNEQAINEARPLSEMSRGRYVLNFALVPFNTLLPDTQNAREVARLLRADAFVRAEKLDVDGALGDVRAIIGVSNSIGDEPFAISQIVRIAVDSFALDTLARILAEGSGSDAALAKLQKRLHEEARIPFNLIAMRGERASSFELLGKLADGTISISELSGMFPKEMKSLGLQSPHGQALFRYNQGLSLRFMNQAVEISKLPLPEQVEKWKAWEAEMKLPSDYWGKVTGSLTYLLLPALNAFASANVRINALLGCAEIMVAMERNRIVNGRWPESLETIPKSILPEVPIDPFSGKPLKTTPLEGNWVVYSVGPNGQDDGGALDPRFDPKTEYSDWGYVLYDPTQRRLPPFYEQELPSQPFLGEPLLDAWTVVRPEMTMESTP